MVGDSVLAERLAALRGRDVVEAAPLWIDRLEPEDGLRELEGRDDTVSRLQRARFLKLLGEEQEAEDVLVALGDLPAGLDAVRREIRDPAAARRTVHRVGTRTVDEPPVVSKTVAELYASQGDVGTAVSIYRQILNRNPGDEGARQRLRILRGAERTPLEAVLSAWLDRVRLWRRALGV